MAICDAPLGGGKSVIAADPTLPPEQRTRLLHRYAALLGSQRGTYFGAPDMNTGPEDMDLIHEVSPYVFCDVFAPCAVGGILNATSIPALRCAVVAGCANNQLATPDDDIRLRERGILYAPDFVANAGGVLHGVGLDLWHWTEQRVIREAQATVPSA